MIFSADVKDSRLKFLVNIPMANDNQLYLCAFIREGEDIGL